MGFQIRPPEREKAKNRRPLICDFYASPLRGEEIELRSFSIIDREAPPHSFSPDEWEVVRRMVHTTGDFSLIDSVRFSKDAISAAVNCLSSGRPIFVDSNMIRAGLSLSRLQSVCRDYGPERIICYVADDEVAQQASQSGLPRSLFGVRKAKPFLDGAVTVFGNSPIALLELNRLIVEEDVRPALVIAMPVGFVHVVESKEELMSLGLSFIALAGRRGGSPLGVSAVHALCSLAASRGQEPVGLRGSS